LKYLAILLLCVSCAAPDHTRLSGSLPANIGLADSTINNVGSGQPIDVIRFTAGPSWTLPLTDWAFFDLGLHGSGTAIVGEQEGGPGIGAEIMVRPRVDLGTVELYFVGTVGFEVYLDGIKGQGSDWGFPLSTGPGVRIELIRDTAWFTIDLRLFHESNGRGVFGHPWGPNPGFNCDLITIGYEWRF
jgi:hypothetical protein